MKHLSSTLAALAAGALLVAPAAEAKPGTTKLTRGATTLTLDSGLASALETAGVAVAPRGPATAPQPGTLRLRLTSGRLSASGDGVLRHAGGFTLTRDATRVVVHNLRLHLDERGSTLTAKAGGSRIVLATLDLSGAATATGRRSVTVTGITAALSAAGAGVLNDAFGTTLAEGAPLGTLDVTAHARTKAAKRARGDRGAERRGRGARGGADRSRGRGDADADADRGSGNDHEDGDDRGRGRDRRDD